MLGALHETVVAPKKREEPNYNDGYTDAQDDPQVIVLLDDRHELLAPVFLLIFTSFQIAEARETLGVFIAVVARCFVSLAHNLLRAEALGAATT